MLISRIVLNIADAQILHVWIINNNFQKRKLILFYILSLNDPINWSNKYTSITYCHLFSCRSEAWLAHRLGIEMLRRRNFYRRWRVVARNRAVPVDAPQTNSRALYQNGKYDFLVEEVQTRRCDLELFRFFRLWLLKTMRCR